MCSSMGHPDSSCNGMHAIVAIRMRNQRIMAVVPHSQHSCYLEAEFGYPFCWNINGHSKDATGQVAKRLTHLRLRVGPHQADRDPP